MKPSRTRSRTRRPAPDRAETTRLILAALALRPQSSGELPTHCYRLSDAGAALRRQVLHGLVELGKVRTWQEHPQYGGPVVTMWALVDQPQEAKS